MNRAVLSVCCAAGGALLAYWLDPVSGRRRRALAADRLAHAAREGRHFTELAVRDATNRSIGLAAEARALLAGWSADDATLVPRVRAQLGRLVSHPHGLHVAARSGRVTLSGPILSREAGAALRCARQVHGVTEVEDRMTRYDSAGRIPALQGGVARPGPARWEFAQQSWAPSARVLAGAIGALLLARAFVRRGPLAALMGLAGGGLLARSTANVDLAKIVRAGGRGVTVEKSIRIAAPVEQVFAFWCDVQNFPRFMTHVHEVTGDVAGTTHWRVDGATGPTVQWTAQCTELVSNRRIAWSTLPESTMVITRAWCRSRTAVTEASACTSRCSTNHRAAPFGERLARVLGFDPKHQLDDDLMRVKSFLETGHAAHDAAASRRALAPAEHAGA